MPLPRPAPCSTSTSCPAPVKARTALGTVATRYSSDLISRGMPTRIRYTPGCVFIHHHALQLLPPVGGIGQHAPAPTPPPPGWEGGTAQTAWPARCLPP